MDVKENLAFSPGHVILSCLDPMVKKKNPHAVALGRLGGLKGGRALAKKLTPEQRSEIARKASIARWAKQKNRRQKP